MIIAHHMHNVMYVSSISLSSHSDSHSRRVVLHCAASVSAATGQTLHNTRNTTCTYCIQEGMLNMYSSCSLVHYYYAVQSTVATSLTQCVCVCDMSSLIACFCRLRLMRRRLSHLTCHNHLHGNRERYMYVHVYVNLPTVHACGPFKNLLT